MLSIGKALRMTILHPSTPSMKARRTTAEGHLDAKEAPFVEPIGRPTDHKCNADVPNCQGARDHQHKALTPVLGYIASAEGPLGSRHEQDDAENGWRKQLQQRRDGPAEERGHCKKHEPKDDDAARRLGRFRISAEVGRPDQPRLLAMLPHEPTFGPPGRGFARFPDEQPYQKLGHG
jgi:hypothetical protein